jgi:hypothetical protein
MREIVEAIGIKAPFQTDIKRKVGAPIVELNSIFSSSDDACSLPLLYPRSLVCRLEFGCMANDSI